MSFLSTITRYAADLRTRRRRMNSYLAIASLPLEIQKDIGWNQVGDDEDGGPARRRRR